MRAPEDFDAGHSVPAVRVPIEVWEAAAKARATFFESDAHWEYEIASLAFGGQLPTLIYENGRMTEAARVSSSCNTSASRTFLPNGDVPRSR